MASILRFDKWEDTQGNSLATVDESGNISMPSLPLGTPNIKRYFTDLRTGITISNVTGLRYTDDISSYITANTYAVLMALRYRHNGSSNHGYFNGYFVQSGNNDDTQKRGVVSAEHYNDYYNTDYIEVAIPWDVSGSSNLETYATYVYNTSSSNTYSTTIVGVLEYG